MVCTLDGGWEILKTSFVAAPDIPFRNIVAAGENAISDSSQVNLDVLRADVDQHDLETTNSRIKHHLQIVLSGQRSLNGEALPLVDMLSCRRQDLTRRCHRKCCGRRGPQCACDHIRI